VATEKPTPPDEPPPPARPETGRRTALAQASPAPPPPPTPSPATATARPSDGSLEDRERQLALQGTQESKMLLKQRLESRVFGGSASDAEIRLLISTCKDLGDRQCVQQARAVQARQQQ